jgi:phosphate transport system substrate-binding protein
MSRKTVMARGIVLIAAAGLAVSACTPPLPPDVLAAKAENQITCQTGSLDVSVPEEFVGAMDSLGISLASVCPDQSLVEVVDDPTAKLRLVDRAPTAEEQAAFKAEACPASPVIVVPAFAYAVALAYDVIGLEGMVLTPQAIAGMLDGSVTSWEDPLIQDANPDYDLTLLPEISLLTLDQPSGSVEAMTAWLSTEDPAAWPAGPTATLDNGTAFGTQLELLDELLLTEGTIAVLPAFAAVNNALPVAGVPVQDLVVSPDDTQLLKVGSGATTITTDEAGNIYASPAIGGVPVEGNFDVAASKIVLAEGQPLIGWPIMGMAHLMVCDDPADPLPLSTAQYALRLAGQGSLETFGVTPLPEPIRIQTFAPLKVTVNLDELEESASPEPSAEPSVEPS